MFYGNFCSPTIRLELMGKRERLREVIEIQGFASIKNLLTAVIN